MKVFFQRHQSKASLLLREIAQSEFSLPTRHPVRSGYNYREGNSEWPIFNLLLA